MIKKFNESENIQSIIKVNTDVIEHSISVNNNRDVMTQEIEIQMESFRNKNKNISKNMTIELTNIFGKHNKMMRLEYNTKVWVLKYNNLIFNIFCSNKGTYIEECNTTSERVRTGENKGIIIKFLNELYKIINE